MPGRSSSSAGGRGGAADRRVAPPVRARDLQRLREREGAVDQVAGRSGARVGDVRVASPAVEVTVAVVLAV